MKIIVTGGTGFIGSHLIAKLVSHNHHIILLKRSTSKLDRIATFLNRLKIYNIDNLRVLDDIFKDNSNIGLIIHLATKYIKNHSSHSEIKEMNNCNINFPTLLLNLASSHNVPYFINTGTCFEYKLKIGKVSENDDISPYNYYAASKLAFEDILRFFTKDRNIKAITLKLFYPYGPMDNQKVIPQIINSLISGNSLKLTPGEQQLNYTYIDDIISAYLKSLTYICSDRYHGYEIFNIGNNQVFPIKNITTILEKISCKKANIIFGAIPYPPNEIMFMNCNNRKAKTILGWQPITNIVEGLTKTYNYYRKYSIIHD